MSYTPPSGKKQLKVLFRLALLALAIGAFLLLATYILSLLGLDNLTGEDIRQKISEFGAWGPLVYILFTFLQVTFIPIPFVVSILAGNLLFGFWGAFFYSLIGSVLGSYFAYWLGRVIGRPFVNWAFGDKEVVEHYLMKTQGKEFVVFFFMFILPFFPDDALCALAGITALNRKQFLFIQLVTRPIAVGVNLLLWTGEFIPYEGWGLVVIAVLVVITVVSFVLGMKYADKINEIFNRVTEPIVDRLYAAIRKITKKPAPSGPETVTQKIESGEPNDSSAMDLSDNDAASAENVSAEDTSSKKDAKDAAIDAKEEEHSPKEKKDSPLRRGIAAAAAFTKRLSHAAEKLFKTAWKKLKNIFRKKKQ